MKLHTRLVRPAAALLALCLALPTFAQPSIDQVPEEAALYVGWRGADDMGPSYEGSNLQGVLEQTGLLQALPQLVDALQTFGEEQGDPEIAELISTGGTLWSAMWQDGGAMYMLPPQEDGPPIPRLAILWNKGEDEGKLRDALSNLVELINDAEQVPAFMGNAGDAVFLSIGFNAGDAAGGSLADTARFKQAAAQVQPDGALVLYVDVQEWIGQVDSFAEMMKQQAEEWDEPADPFAQLWPTLRDVSGLSGVNRLMFSAGIADKNWHTKMFLDAPAPRTGILSLMDNKAIQEPNLTHVPKTATYLQVFTIDPARVLDVTRDMLGAVDAGVAEELDAGLAEASEAVGFDLERELINGFGPVWSIYIDPMIAGNGFSSLVFVNELRDADRVEQSLLKLSEAANEAMAGVMDGEDVPLKIRLLTREVKGTRITHLGIPYIAPAYMVHGGRLYVSLFPQALEMALEHSGEKADSILANETFVKTLDQFEDKGFTGLSFTDLPETAPDGYGINLMFMQVIAGVTEMFGGEAATVRMPPIGKVMPFIEPSGAVTWVDDLGLHVHSIEPFPGSALLGPAKGLESTMAISGPMAVAVVLPALGSARDAAMQTQTMSNGRQLAMAAHAYAVDHKDEFPTDIAELYQGYVDFEDVFFSPKSIRAEPMPFNFDDWDKNRQNAFIRKNSSFVLVSGLRWNDDNPSQKVLLFQRPDDTAGDKLVVCYLDGHAETHTNTDRLEQQLKAQTGKTIDELIRLQEQIGQ